MPHHCWRAWTLTGLIALAGPAFSAVADGPAHVSVRPADIRDGASLSIDEARAVREALVQLGFEIDRCGHHTRAGTLGVDVLDDADRQRLRDAGFTIVSEVLLTPGLRTQLEYYDPTEIATILQQTAAAHPDITRVFSIGSTFQRRPIWAIEISDNPGASEDEPAIQFNGQHHAREVATSHIVVDVIEQLTNNYGTDPEITNWVNSYKTVCVPMVNPDGVAYVFSGSSLWRKNRQQYTCIGVDLNRNYPYLWGPGCGSSNTCTSDIYRGPSSASELETQAMIGLIDDFHFVMATSYHSYGRFIDYPYACATGAPSTLMPEHAVIHEMMNGMADAIDSVDSTPRYTVYSPVPFGGVNGDDTSWYYAHRGTYAFIVEVGTSFEPAFNLVAGIVNRNRAGWKYQYQRLSEARIDVHVVDACSGLPLEAAVTLTNYVFDTGELPRGTFMPFGRWTYVVPPNGTYTVRASKPGYVTQDVPIQVVNEPAELEIALVQVNPPLATFGDADCDGDVDAADLARFIECLAGPQAPFGSLCDLLDSNSNGRVDLLDFQEFQQTFSG